MSPSSSDPASSVRGAPGGRPERAFARAVVAVATAIVAGIVGAPATVAAQLPATLDARVLAHPGDVPLAGAFVEIFGSLLTGRTDPDGRLTLRGLAPGTHTIVATHPGYHPVSASVEVANGRVTHLELILTRDPVPLDEIVARGIPDRIPAGGILLRPDRDAPGARSVAELVQAAPGVTVVRRGGPGAPATASIRGSSSDQVLVLVDGVPVNAPLTGEADLSIIELGTVERVIVLPGAASARYGGGALAGVILIETRSSARGIGAGVVAGSHGERSAHLSVSTGRIELRVQGDRARGDFRYPLPTFRGGGDARRENAELEAIRGHVAATLGEDDPGDAIRNGSGLRGRLRAHAERIDRGAPGTIVQPSLTGAMRHERVGVVTSLEEGDAMRGWRVASAASAHRAEHRDPSPPFGSAYHAETRVREAGLDTEIHGGSDEWSFRAGAGARTRALRGPGLGDDAPDGIHQAGAWIEAGRRIEHHRADAGITGGLRADAHTLVDGLSLSPALTIDLRGARSRLSLRWANAFAPPSVADLFFEEGVLVRANPELEPERVRGEWSVELTREMALAEGAGRGSAPAPSAELRLSFFRGDVDGMILWFPDHRFIWSPSNFDVRRRGGSLGVELRWPRLGVMMSGSADRAHVTYAGPVLSGPVAYRPEWRGSVRVTRAWRGGSLDGARLRAEFRSYGARRTVPGSPLNALPAFSTIDAGLRVPLPPGIRDRFAGGSIDFGVRNLADIPASFLADYPLPGRWWTLAVRIGGP